MLKVFELLKGSTSVELKLMVPDRATARRVKRLGFDPVEAEPRQAYFFDTPDLALNKAGVVVRARRIRGGGGDTVVKLRPVDPAALDPELRAPRASRLSSTPCRAGTSARPPTRARAPARRCST